METAANAVPDFHSRILAFASPSFQCLTLVISPKDADVYKIGSKFTALDTAKGVGITGGSDLSCGAVTSWQFFCKAFESLAVEAGRLFFKAKNVGRMMPSSEITQASFKSHYYTVNWWIHPERGYRAVAIIDEAGNLVANFRVETSGKDFEYYRGDPQELKRTPPDRFLAKCAEGQTWEAWGTFTFENEEATALEIKAKLCFALREASVPIPGSDVAVVRKASLSSLNRNARDLNKSPVRRSPSPSTVRFRKLREGWMSQEEAAREAHEKTLMTREDQRASRKRLRDDVQDNLTNTRRLRAQFHGR